MSKSIIPVRKRAGQSRGSPIGYRTLPSKTKRNKPHLKKEMGRSKSSSEFVYYKNKVCEKDGCNEKSRYSISSLPKSILVCVKHKQQYSIKR